jgi:hypothetical protein
MYLMELYMENISFCINMKTAKCMMKTKHIQQYTSYIIKEIN